MSDGHVNLSGNFSFDKQYLYFKNAAGEVMFTLPLGIVYEKNNFFNQSDMVFRFQRIGNFYYLFSGIRVPVLNRMNFPVVFDPTDTFYSEADDGFVTNMVSNAVDNVQYWYECRDATTGTDKSSIASAAGEIFKASKIYNSKTGEYEWSIIRSFYGFITENISDNAVITNVSLKIMPFGFYFDDTACIQEGTQGDDLTVDDFNAFTGTVLDSKEWTLGGYIVFYIEDYSVIDKTGKSYFCLREYEHDYQNVTPGFNAKYHGGGYYSEQTGTDQDPGLWVEYTIPTNTNPTQSGEVPANNSADIPVLPTLHVVVSDADDDTMNVTWWSNSSGSWLQFASNNSVANNTNVSQVNSNFSGYDTTYWWQVCVNDGHGGWSNETYHFTTTSDSSPPEITINFAGNPNDIGGPYFIPGKENLSSNGPYCPDGYYADGSMQQEDWIFINCTVSDPGGVDNVVLCWYNATTNTWDNSTSFTNVNGDYWEVNTSGNIVITSGHKYSFHVKASDIYNNENISFWNKSHNDSVRYRERYVYLGCTPSSFEYMLLNLSDYPTYPEGIVNTFYTYDSSYHDQSPGGDATDSSDDTGQLTSKLLTDVVNDNFCTIWAGFWMNETYCADAFTLNNVYYHVWASAEGTGEVNISICKERSKNTYTGIKPGNWKHYTPDDGKSTIIYDPYGPNGNSTFKLYADVLYLGTSFSMSDNNIYELLFNVKDIDPDSDNPHVISNVSFPSFVLFNIPDNNTLNTTYGDSDNDGLNDWNELYITYTNPFIDDTDNDGYSDYDEYIEGSDPNNYTDVPVAVAETIYQETIRNNGDDYFTYLGGNITASDFAVNISGFDESNEYIAIWNNGTWDDNNANWLMYYGDGTGTDFTLHTFNIIHVYLTDSGTQVINMTENTFMNYTNSKTYPLRNFTNNKGYNYSGYNRPTSTTLSSINSSIGLEAGEFLALWNETNYNWDIYISDLPISDKDVHQWDVILTKVENDETWVT